MLLLIVGKIADIVKENTIILAYEPRSPLNKLATHNFGLSFATRTSQQIRITHKSMNFYLLS